MKFFSNHVERLLQIIFRATGITKLYHNCTSKSTIHTFFRIFQILSRGWTKIICTNIFNCSASNTHSTRLRHAIKLFIRKFPLKWGIVRFCRSYITRDMGQNVFSRFYEFFKNLRKKFVSKNWIDVFSSGV